MVEEGHSRWRKKDMQGCRRATAFGVFIKWEVANSKQGQNQEDSRQNRIAKKAQILFLTESGCGEWQGLKITKTLSFRSQGRGDALKTNRKSRLNRNSIFLETMTISGCISMNLKY